MTVDHSMPGVVIRGLPGIPEVHAGDDIATLVLDAVDRSAEPLADGDIVVVTSKIVSKAEGRVVPGNDREAAIDAQTVRVVSRWRTPRGLTRIVENRQGLVMAAAGVDDSNVAAGHVVVLPEDPDASARRLRADLRDRTGTGALGVIITDTAGRSWREGVVDLAIGAAGVQIVDDYRGRTDRYGNALEVTVVAQADEIAAASELVRRKLADVPVAVVRGLADLVTDDDGPGARRLIRPSSEDRFRLGTPEAMRAAVLQAKDVRRFTGAPVDDELLEDALHVAAAAPRPPWSVPPWRLEVVTKPDQIETILAAFPEYDDVTGVTAIIVPRPDDQSPRTAIALGAALQNVRIRLAADAIGTAYLFPADADAFGVVVAGHPA